MKDAGIKPIVIEITNIDEAVKAYKEQTNEKSASTPKPALAKSC
jgi:predicted Fe-Mo cluster-binding NifX family protein